MGRNPSGTLKREIKNQNKAEFFATLKALKIASPEVAFKEPVSADNWLVNYALTDGIAYTFDRMKRRASRPHLLDGTVHSLERDRHQLDEEFNRFFPEVKELAGSFP